MKSREIKDCAVTGFALFGMFFGAGNLIFPPFLGSNGGSKWFLGFICFLIMDIGLSMFSILSIGKNGDDASCLTE
ncbi:MAG: branched-chain amino acid transport system II carrier protein, partial [Oscillospiraceae bacterium]